MPIFIALLRAVNVGGTGKLPMAELRAICLDAGFSDARTVLASGNAVFRSDRTEKEVRADLEARLERRSGVPVGVIVRTAAELDDVLRHNPFPGAAGDRVMALFTDVPLPGDPLEGVSGRKNEEVALGTRELFIHYPQGQADTRLRLPAMRNGTARNLNTVTKLAAVAATLACSPGAEAVVA